MYQLLAALTFVLHRLGVAGPLDVKTPLPEVMKTYEVKTCGEPPNRNNTAGVNVVIAAARGSGAFGNRVDRLLVAIGTRGYAVALVNWKILTLADATSD